MEAESTRAQKIARQIQRDVSDILQKEASALARGTMVSVTVVRMSPDLSMAKVFFGSFYICHNHHLIMILRSNWSVRIFAFLILLPKYWKISKKMRGVFVCR